MNNLILHGGFHKTGTTFLQESVFCKLSDIIYLGKPWKDDKILEIVDYFYTANDIDIDTESIRTRFQLYLEEELKLKNTNILLSSEGLFSGYEWFGRYYVHMLERIKNLLQPAKLILGIRNQSDYIKSIYKQYVREGGQLSFTEFLHTEEVKSGLMPKLKYDLVIETMYDIFGKDQVHIYQQEKLKSNCHEEIKKIIKFIDSDFDVNSVDIDQKHISLTDFKTNIIRHLNSLIGIDFFMHRNINTNKKKLQSKIVDIIEKVPMKYTGKKLINESQINYIQEYYSESNKNLLHILGGEYISYH